MLVGFKPGRLNSPANFYSEVIRAKWHLVSRVATSVRLNFNMAWHGRGGSSPDTSPKTRRRLMRGDLPKFRRHADNGQKSDDTACQHLRAYFLRLGRDQARKAGKAFHRRRVGG